MKRRRLLATLAAGAFGCPLAAFAQGDAKVFRIGLLEFASRGQRTRYHATLMEGLRELGYVEGRNVVVDFEYAGGDQARLAAVTAALVSRKPDLIYLTTWQAALAVQAQTRTIPVVFGAMTDPVEHGVVKTLARPGGNMTGIANISWALGPKRMQLLGEALPKVSRVAVLVTGSTIAAREAKLIGQAARPNVKVRTVTAKEPREIDAAFASFAESGVEAVLLTHTTQFFAERRRITDLGLKHRIPVIGHRNEVAEAGALMSYSSSLNDQVRRSAHLVNKVLKGASPADIPVEQPTRFDLVVNLKTAAAIGVTVPKTVLLQATRVIE
jgi:putative ABC transport system substrate-binding protein